MALIKTIQTTFFQFRSVSRVSILRTSCISKFNMQSLTSRLSFTHNFHSTTFKSQLTSQQQELIDKVQNNPELMKLFNNKEIVLQIQNLQKLLIEKGIDINNLKDMGPMSLFKLMNDKDIKLQGEKIQELVIKNNIKLSATDLLSLFSK